jgi:hypothetical protein
MEGCASFNRRCDGRTTDDRQLDVLGGCYFYEYELLLF